MKKLTNDAYQIKLLKCCVPIETQKIGAAENRNASPIAYLATTSRLKSFRFLDWPFCIVTIDPNVARIMNMKPTSSA